ncbi:transcriptional regulator, IclR family [Alteribacillus persepolensis]|uniref:Glycerol operon regulatory protein n=1 Tax=Alteribacillus persepolensis TaxID=568899 RepID=A0A1G8FVF8_9BACI|nr:IclR family transcriptional regulator [Alteribacillus persepolensis]SDH86121.1 transcriptional regulator, IclR family [Alteribacillus persepolensis]
MKQQRYSSLENALRLLELFRVEESELALKVIADKLSIAESTAHRLLTTLKEEGFVAKDDVYNNYRLGVSIRALEAVLIKDIELYNQSLPILNALADKTGENASVCIIFRGETLYINTVESPNTVYENLTYPGKSQSVLDTSAGKILICEYNESHIKKVLKNVSLESYTQYISEQPVICEQGYAVSYNNFSSGLTSVAVPVKNLEGTITAAVELIGLEQRFSREKIHSYVLNAKEAAVQLKKQLFQKNKQSFFIDRKI